MTRLRPTLVGITLLTARPDRGRSRRHAEQLRRGVMNRPRIPGQGHVVHHDGRLSQGRQRTADATDRQSGGVVINANEHTWQTRSRHSTSEGVVCYQHCHCGRWRVVLTPRRRLVDAETACDDERADLGEPTRGGCS